MPTPASTNGTTNAAYPACVCASWRIQRNPSAWSTRPGAARARAPTRSTSLPAIGAIRSGVIVQGRNRSPVPSGESPRAIWKYWLVTYAVAKIDAAIRNWVQRRGREHPRAEQRQRHHRRRRDGLPAPRTPTSRTTPRASATSTSVDPQPASGARSTPHTSDAHRTGGGDHPDRVEPGARTVGLGQDAEDGHDGGDAERHVHPEDPVPVEALGDHAADQRSGRDTETGDAAPDPDDRAAAVGRERRREQGQAEGHHDRRAEALDGPEADQDAEIRRERAGGRGEAEQHAAQRRTCVSARAGRRARPR